tara:strand:+ start:94 stop:366 length:273 start_codon:yes stop_codon:yes gene_type:complete
MAFFKWQKAPTKKVPKRAWSDEEMKMIGWCMHTGIKISIMPDWKHPLIYWKIEISIKGNLHADPKRYDDSNILNKKLEYYKYYYDKHNKQ